MAMPDFAPHTEAFFILAKIKAEMAAIPMGRIARDRTYRHTCYRDVDVAGFSAHAPDGTERWSLSIVGGSRPQIELAMWHGVKSPCLAFTPYELAALDRANAHLDGLIVRALNQYEKGHAEALIVALDDRHDLVLQTALEGVA